MIYILSVEATSTRQRIAFSTIKTISNVMEKIFRWLSNRCHQKILTATTDALIWWKSDLKIPVIQRLHGLILSLGWLARNRDFLSLHASHFLLASCVLASRANIFSRYELTIFVGFDTIKMKNFFIPLTAPAFILLSFSKMVD